MNEPPSSGTEAISFNGSLWGLLIHRFARRGGDGPHGVLVVVAALKTKASQERCVSRATVTPTGAHAPFVALKSSKASSASTA